MSYPNIKKKVLLVTPFLQAIGGVANYYKTILPLLKESNFNIDYLEIGSAKSNNNPFHSLADQIKFYHKIKTGYDLVHVNPSLDLKSFIRDGLFIRIAKRHDIPVIVFFRGWDQNFAKYIESYFLRLFWFTYGKADAFILLASQFEKKLRSWGITSPSYLQTTTIDHNLLNGVDIENKIKSFRQKKTIRILYLARIERAKGVFETVDAIRILHQNQVQVQLSIAGDGPARYELESYVRTIGLSAEQNGQINFLGYIRDQDKAAAFLNHDIYCLPSYSEGLPNSVLEAMVFGLPVITCAVGGLVDLFRDTDLGSLVPLQNPQAIAETIEAFAKDRQRMTRIAINNHSYAKENFLAPKVANKLLKVYQQTINNTYNER